MVTVFVMAQGQQQRIGHLMGVNGMPSYKHLLKVSETETILSRACRLFLEAGADQVIPVVHLDMAFVNPCMDLGLPFFVQRDPGASILNGIYNVRKAWGSRTVIALGDVVYSRATARMMVMAGQFEMFERAGENVTTGNPYPERFGISFSSQNHAALVEVLERPGFRNHSDHKLIHLKAALAGQLAIREVTDYTDDVDTEKALKEWFPRLKAAAAIDT